MCLLSLLSPPYHNQSHLGIDSEFNLLKVNLPSYFPLSTPLLSSLSVVSLSLSPLSSAYPRFSLSRFCFPVFFVSIATSTALCLTRRGSCSPPGGSSGGDTMLNLHRLPPCGPRSCWDLLIKHCVNSLKSSCFCTLETVHRLILKTQSADEDCPIQVKDPESLLCWDCSVMSSQGQKWTFLDVKHSLQDLKCDLSQTILNFIYYIWVWISFI